MEYTVGLAVNGRVYIRVKVDSFDEAKEKACAEVYELDFGPLESIDWTVVNAETENGNFRKY